MGSFLVGYGTVGGPAAVSPVARGAVVGAALLCILGTRVSPEGRPVL